MEMQPHEASSKAEILLKPFLHLPIDNAFKVRTTLAVETRGKKLSEQQVV